MEYVPYLSIVVAFALIYIPRFIASAEMGKLDGGYDNRDPRGQQLQLAGLGKRAIAAHQNGFEAFGPFAIAVMMCAQRGAKLGIVASICLAFVAVRSVYMFAYLRDVPRLRSSMWTLGMLAIAALMTVAVIG